MVGNSRPGVWFMIRKTERAGGSSRIFRSALAALRFMSSAGSMIAIRQLVREPVAWKKRLSLRTPSTVIWVRKPVPFSTGGRVTWTRPG